MSAGLYLHIPFCQKRCDYCDFYTMAGRGDLFAPYTTALLHALNTAPLPAAGLYLHIPFCQKRCDYCDFYTMAGRGDLFAPYTTALLHALNTAPLPAGSRVDTVYFGGGTPTMLGAARLCTLLEGIRQRYTLAPDAEITLEANPIAITPQMASTLRAGGFNRISMGLQSANPAQLRDLGRTHTAEKAAEAVQIVRAAGFENLSLDLMLGLPHQTVEEVLGSIRFAAQLGAAEKAAEAVQIVRAAGFENLSLDLMLGLPHQTVEEVLGSIRFAAQLGALHLSAYMLQLEEGTPYAARYTESDIDEETQRQIYLSAIAELERLGYRQYEISNFARPGYESRHNLKYWRCEEYLGLGPAAASCFGGRRFAFPRDIDAFLSAKHPWSLCEDEGEAGSPEERVAMALRLCEGLDCTALEQACPGFDAGALIQRASRPELKPFCTVTGRAVALTPQGFLLEGSIQRASRPELKPFCTVTGRAVALTPQGFLLEGSLIPLLLWG